VTGYSEKADMADSERRVSLREICGVFFRIGLFSFGGGVGGWIHREAVTIRRWMSNDEFLAGMALSQILPGANVSNLTVYIGERLRGPLGATTALVALLSGPFVLILVLAQISAELKGQPLFHAGMEGIAAAAVGLVMNIGVVGTRQFVRSVPSLVVMAATFVAIGIAHLALFPTVAVMAPVSVGLALARRRLRES
jgi:chromate transporter